MISKNLHPIAPIAAVIAAAVICVGCPIVQPTVPALPIPVQLTAEPVPAFIGGAAVPAPIQAAAIPQNPHLARNDRSGAHNDTYMSDTYQVSGPLGNSPEVRASYLGGICISVCFDRAGRILTIALGRDSTRLWLLDPATLAPLSYLDLPAKPYVAGTFPSGSYFVLDNEDRALIPTIDRTVWVVKEKDPLCDPRLELVRIYDIASVVPDEDDQIGSVVPDFSGLIWFVTDKGIIGNIEPHSGSMAAIALDTGETIANSFAIDETGGVFVASDRTMYRFDAGDRDVPVITWQEDYDRGARLKPGQHSQGTGTTPTLIGADYVAITDNADPYMNVLVYRRAPQIQGDRLALKQPVFAENAGCTENSLIATERSIVVENNYGYANLASTSNGQTTQPGITRIDLEPNGGGHVVWTSQERIPSAISKLSVANGIVYSYCKDPGPNTTDAWYFLAIDFATGQTLFKQLAGTGLYYNNNYAGLYLGPDGTAYVGVLSGLVAMRDPS